jgi:hypothetical protein
MRARGPVETGEEQTLGPILLGKVSRAELTRCDAKPSRSAGTHLSPGPRRMGGNQKGFSAIGECGVGNLRRTDRRLLTATPLHLKGQKIADYMRRLGLR